MSYLIPQSLTLSLVPNFTLLNAGHNNQFRVNIFFPEYDKGKNNGGKFITMMSAEDFALWYNKVFLPALRIVVRTAPRALREAAIRLSLTLPKSYKIAERRAVRSGGRSFTGYKIIPQLMNMILAEARRIVNSKPELSKFLNYFLHVWGIDLKPVAQVIEPGKGDTLLHLLESYPIVDWSLQNPRDIVVDVGVEVNVREETLPLDINNLTLIWKVEALKRLIMESWRKPTIDAYVHSHVVGGINCKPRSHVAKMMYFFHAYQKDKTLTYIHRDNSIGAGFSPEDGIMGTKAYFQETTSLEETWSESVGSYGARAEWRCTVWAAIKALAIDPDTWLRRFLSEGAIVSLNIASNYSSPLLITACDSLRTIPPKLLPSSVPCSPATNGSLPIYSSSQAPPGEQTLSGFWGPSWHILSMGLFNVLTT